jgi:NADH dehydrogenase FAD-containing subunit
VDTWPEKNITLVNGPKQILPTMPSKTRVYASKWLLDRGVKILVGKYVQEDKLDKSDIESKSCTFVDGEVMSADVVLSCVGNGASNRSASFSLSSLFELEGVCTKLFHLVFVFSNFSVNLFQ